MIELNNVEIISINTHNPIMSVKALQYSCKDIKFAKRKILSDVLPSNITDDIEWIKIPKFITRFDYSDFVLKELHKYIDSEYVMMIHDDGFIINSHLWNNEFLKYDYIGAPWPGEDGQLDGRVGNGGFCIRSRKLIEFCSKMEYIQNHDDWIIGVTNNIHLKENGFTFAPVRLAMRFALELPISECEYNLDNVFGFHGKHTQRTLDKTGLLNYI